MEGIPHMSSVFVCNPAKLEEKKAIIRTGGAAKLHVVSDFDKTLSCAHQHGEKRRSLVELIRKHKYLSDDYVKKAYELFDTYHPYEIDPQLDSKTKSAKMLEWWSTHVKVMGQHGMSKQVVERIVQEQDSGLRKGLGTFLDTLNKKHIPLLILSSSVTDLVEGFLKKENMLYPNIHVISNKYKYDENGKVKGYEGNIVHSLNKDQTVIKGTKYEKMVEQRKNVLLLGDTLDDIGMLAGFEHDVVIKIGFLSEDVEKKLPAYKEVYDVIILNDGNFDFVNELLESLIA